MILIYNNKALVKNNKCIDYDKYGDYYIWWDDDYAYVTTSVSGGEISTLYPASSAPYTDPFIKVRLTASDYMSNPVNATKLIVRNKYPMVTSLYNLCFQGAGMKDVDLSGLNTTLVNDMANVFYGCTSLKNVNFGNIDTSNVVSFSGLFTFCQAIENIDVSKFDTSNALTLHGMFGQCNNLGSIDVSNFDTSKVLSMRQMFRLCGSLTSLDTSNFVTSNVMDFSEMFRGTKFTNLNLSNFDTSSAVYDESPEAITVLNRGLPSLGIRSMFFSCNKLVTLDISNFNIDNLPPEGITSLFYDCGLLRTVYVDNCSDVTITKLLTALNTTDTPYYGPGGFTLGTRDGRRALIKD